MARRDAAGRPFPTEAEWLELAPPDVAPGFVERTLARLSADGLVRAADAGPGSEADDLAEADDAGLPADLLAHYASPPPSPGFVEHTLARVQRDRAEHWRQLLLRYESPEPTPDFVARTLRALRAAPKPGPWRRWRPLLVLGSLAAAAAVAILLWPSRPASLRSFVAAAPRPFAYAQSPVVLTHLLAAPHRHDALPLFAPDPAWLWLAAAEDRR